MLSAGFEPTMSVIKQPQTHALKCADTGFSKPLSILYKMYNLFTTTFQQRSGYRPSLGMFDTIRRYQITFDSKRNMQRTLDIKYIIS